MVLKCPGSLFFVCYSPVSLMKASPVGFQSWVFWWPIPRVGALKVGALNVPLKETLGVGGAPPPRSYGAVSGVGFLGKVCLSISH